MDEAVVADIQTHMRKLEAAGIKKHQIAGLQLIFADRFTHASLLARAAWQRQAGGLLKNVANQPTAIEP